MRHWKAEYATSEDLPEDADRRLGKIEQRLAQLDDRPQAFAAAEVARAGAFVSVDYVGVLKVERGYVRPEDEPREAEPESAVDTSEPDVIDGTVDRTVSTIDAMSVGQASTSAEAPDQDEQEEDDGGRISDPADDGAHGAPHPGVAGGARGRSGCGLPRGAARPGAEDLLRQSRPRPASRWMPRVSASAPMLQG